ncbi:MAG: DoxX family protein [Gemmatimonadaceae bacterium]
MTATATAPGRAQEVITTGFTGGWLRSLIWTDRSGTALLLRLTLALVMFPHGAQKMLGWFGGPGFAGEMSLLTETVGLPSVIAFLVIFIEFFGSIGLALGFLGRVAAAGIASVMIGAVLTMHVPFGFFMNWFGTQTGEGFEYHLLAIGIAAAIMINGSGTLSIDRALTGRGNTVQRPRRTG